MPFRIVVDANGFPAYRVDYEQDDPLPDLNPPRKTQGGHRVAVPDEQRKHYLPEGLDLPGFAKPRWDFAAEQWVAPDREGWLVNARGEAPTRVRWHSAASLRVPPGAQLVTTPPPNLGAGRRPIWDGRQWRAPRRYGIVREEDGVVLDVVLINPRDSAEEHCPAGCSMVEDTVERPVMRRGRRNEDGTFSPPPAPTEEELRQLHERRLVQKTGLTAAQLRAMLEAP